MCEVEVGDIIPSSQKLGERLIGLMGQEQAREGGTSWIFNDLDHMGTCGDGDDDRSIHRWYLAVCRSAPRNKVITCTYAGYAGYSTTEEGEAT